MQPEKRKKRFYIITAAVLIAIFAIAIGIVLYTDYSYVNVEVTGNTHAYFVLAYDNTSVTLNQSESATIAVLPHANVTLTAVVSPSYTVTGWMVTGASYHQTGNDSINFITGSGATTIEVSVELSGPATG